MKKYMDQYHELKRQERAIKDKLNTLSYSWSKEAFMQYVKANDQLYSYDVKVYGSEGFTNTGNNNAFEYDSIEDLFNKTIDRLTHYYNKYDLHGGYNVEIAIVLNFDQDNEATMTYDGCEYSYDFYFIREDE
jgi:hypothetical protein